MRVDFKAIFYLLNIYLAAITGECTAKGWGWRGPSPGAPWEVCLLQQEKSRAALGTAPKPQPSLSNLSL